MQEDYQQDSERYLFYFISFVCCGCCFDQFYNALFLFLLRNSENVVRIFTSVF